MGATQSFVNPTPTESPNSCSTTVIAETVASYGGQYESYKHVIEENGIDGEFLTSLSEDEFLETLDDLKVVSRLHRRKLLNEFRRRSSSTCSDSETDCDKKRSSSKIDGASISVASTTDSSSSCLSQQEIMEALLEEQSTLLRQNLALLSHRRRGSDMMRAMAARHHPEHKAALVLTDIEGSTNLWEGDPHAMKQALKLHDNTMRQVIGQYFGYEFNTEGDAFAVAFYEAADALGFALAVQEALGKAAWSDRILALPWACDDGKGRRGLRVRMSVYMGDVSTRTDTCTGQIKYSGEAMDVAKSLEGVAKGGQIVTTHDTWSAACGLIGASPPAPKVADLGVYTLTQKKHSGIKIQKRIMEIVPSFLDFMST